MSNIDDMRLDGTFTLRWKDWWPGLEFRKAAALIGDCWALLQRKQEGKEDTCTVLVNCEEKGRLRLRTGTYVVGTEGMPKHLMHALTGLAV
jgi:hypothetical protein